MDNHWLHPAEKMVSQARLTAVVLVPFIHNKTFHNL